MPWQRIAVIVLAGLVGGLLVGLLEHASGGSSHFSQIGFLMTVVAIRLFWWKRDSTDRGGRGGPR